MLNIQIYCLKKNFDVQKAERFFKERRIPYQLVDMKKHAPGVKELTLFARAAGGADRLLDKGSERVRSHPACYTPVAEDILAYIAEDPSLMITPVVRNGRLATVGADENAWRQWVLQDQDKLGK